MPTAVDYARYSSDRQSESSIEAQQAALDKYAAAHGITIVQRYVDRAKSARSDQRPAFLQLLADLKTRRVDFVLVHKWDRFARNRYHAEVYKRLIAERGARLITIAQDFGTGPEAVIMEALMQGMAEYYSLNLGAEVVKGRKVKLSKAEHPGGTYPFGYQSDGCGGYAIVEIEAYYLRRLAQATLEGTPSYRSIITEMTSVGVVGRRGKPISPGNVAAMLRLPIYAGIYAARAGDESSVIHNHHPAIFTEDYQQEVIRVLASRQNVGRCAENRRKYLCTGFAFCASCGGPLYGHAQRKDGKEYISYVCYKACGGVRMIRAEELDRAACEYVNALMSPGVRQQLTAAFNTYVSERRALQVRDVQDNAREISRLHAQIDALMGNLASGVLPPSVLERIGNQITDLENQIALLEAAATPVAELTPIQIEDYFRDAAAVSPEGDYAHVRAILQQFIARITLHSTSIEFESTFDGWIQQHCPELTPARLASYLPPQGASNPKGVESPASSANPPDDDDDPPPRPRGRRKSKKSDAAPASSCNQFSESPIPASRSKRFGEITQLLFGSTFVHRLPRNHGGCVAERVVGLFVQNDNGLHMIEED